jgi:hypothetical protein
MGTHHQQIRAAPQCPVTLADRHVAALIGVLAVLEGQVLSGEASPHMTRQLSDRLMRYGLLPVGAANQPLAGALVWSHTSSRAHAGKAERRDAAHHGAHHAALATSKAVLHGADRCVAAT